MFVEVALIFALGVGSFVFGRRFERAHAWQIFDRPAELAGNVDDGDDGGGGGDDGPVWVDPDTAIEDMLFNHAEVRDAVAQAFVNAPRLLRDEATVENEVDEIMDLTCERWRESVRQQNNAILDITGDR
jgi:hypothetical protein